MPAVYTSRPYPTQGYVGYEEGGQLTKLLAKKSNAVVLLDEVPCTPPPSVATRCHPYLSVRPAVALRAILVQACSRTLPIYCHRSATPRNRLRRWCIEIIHCSCLSSAPKAHLAIVVSLLQVEKAHPDVLNLMLQLFDEGS